MDEEKRTLGGSTRFEVIRFLAKVGETEITFPEISHEGLNALRDVLGTEQMDRISALGLKDPDAYRYAKMIARGVISLIVQSRHRGTMDPLDLALNALAVGYERGVRDATDMEISPEAMTFLSDKVDAEEEGGREVERFRKELEDL